MSERIKVVQPADWPRPRGYSNGMISDGPLLHVAGQIGWEPDGSWQHLDVLGQFGRALDNVLAVVEAAGGQPSDVVRLTIYCTDIPAYRAAVAHLGGAWKARFGRHYPAMALLGVSELVEPRAKIEIEAVACLPREEG